MTTSLAFSRATIGTRLLLAFLALICATVAPATSLVRVNGDYTVGYPCTMADGSRFVCPSTTLTDSSGNELGTVGSPVNVASPTGTSANQVQGAGASGAALVGKPVRVGGSNGTNTYDIQTDSAGVLVGPKAGTADRVVTKTNLSANTSTQICPTATNPIATEIFFTTAGVGISLAGGTLTQATVGTTASTTPDWYQNAANTDWLSPAAITNAITAYGAAGIVTCIQWIRQ